MRSLYDLSPSLPPLPEGVPMRVNGKWVMDLPATLFPMDMPEAEMLLHLTTMAENWATSLENPV